MPIPDTERGEAPSPRGRVLVAVEDANRPMTADDLASTLGLHPATVRMHLRRLVANGQVEQQTERLGGRGRPRRTFHPAPPAPATRLVSALVGVLGDSESEREARAALAGHAWAAEVTGADSFIETERDDAEGVLDPLDVSAHILRALGFEIRQMSSVFGVHEIRVCSCPLRDVAKVHPEVARGLQRGAVEYALRSASPHLADVYEVESRPDHRFGDCEVTLRITPDRSTTRDKARIR